MRKHYRDKNYWERAINTLDCNWKASERRNIRVKAALSDIQRARRYYLNAFAAPNRNCDPWQKRIQALTGQRLAEHINNILRNGLHTK